jgi:hypothetical protein
MGKIVVVFVALLVSSSSLADNTEVISISPARDEQLLRWLNNSPSSACPNYQVLIPAVVDPLLKQIYVNLPRSLQGFKPKLPKLLVNSLSIDCEDRSRDAENELKHAVLGFVARGVTRGSLDWVVDKLPLGLKIDVKIDYPDKVAIRFKYKF